MTALHEAVKKHIEKANTEIAAGMKYRKWKGKLEFDAGKVKPAKKFPKIQMVSDIDDHTLYAKSKDKMYATPIHLDGLSRSQIDTLDKLLQNKFKTLNFVSAVMESVDSTNSEPYYEYQFSIGGKGDKADLTDKLVAFVKASAAKVLANQKSDSESEKTTAKPSAKKPSAKTETPATKAPRGTDKLKSFLKENSIDLKTLKTMMKFVK